MVKQMTSGPERVFGPQSRLRPERRKDEPEVSVAAELNMIQVRHELSEGLSKMNLNGAQIALVKSWYLGFLTKEDLREITKFELKKFEAHKKPNATSRKSLAKPTNKPEG